MGCLRFRLGSHHLHVHTGRWCVPPTPVSESTCKRCAQHLAVDDETYCVLHCTQPILVAVRARLYAASAQVGCLDHGHPLLTFQHFCHFWGRKSVEDIAADLLLCALELHGAAILMEVVTFQ